MFEEEMQKTGLKLSFQKMMLSACLASLAAAAALEILLPESMQLKNVLAIAVLFMPPLALYFLFEYLHSRKAREIEEKLPAALFQIAAFPRKTSMERVISSISKGDYGALSTEFAKAERQIKAGVGVSEALEEMGERSDSVLFNRTVALLVESYRSGADMSTAFKEIADDSFELQALSKESASSLALQKYTLLVGGGLLVPVILALLLNIVASLDFEGLEGIALPEHARSLLMNAFIGANQVYLMMFAALASAFVALQEGTGRKGILYFALILPASMLAFHIVRGMALF